MGRVIRGRVQNHLRVLAREPKRLPVHLVLVNVDGTVVLLLVVRHGAAPSQVVGSWTRTGLGADGAEAYNLDQRPSHSPLVLCVEDEDEVIESGGAVERARFDAFAPYDLLRIFASHPC